MGYNFTSEDIKRVLKEISQVIIGARIQAVYQPLKEEVYLEVYTEGISTNLLISIENGFNRLYFTLNRPQNPKNPFSFQMLLRKYLVPSYITDISQVNDDLVVLIKTDEFRLYAELLGRHSNIFLTDTEDVILGSLRENTSQRRPLFVSHKYIPPFKRDLGDKSGVCIPDGCNVSEFYEDYYRKVINEYRMRWLRDRILGRLNARRRHLLRLKEKIESDRSRAQKYSEFLRYAEALKQRRITGITEGIARCEYFNEEGISLMNVPLIRGTDIAENMEYYYKLYKKYKNALPLIEKRASEIEEVLKEVKERISSVESANDLMMLKSFDEPESEESERDILKRDIKEKRYPFRVFYAEGTGRIYSGSDAEENEILTFRYARGNDLWFHVIGYSGSHTVLPLDKNKMPSERQILTAALLAAARSSAPDGETVEVAFTKVKYVRKVRGGAKGAVIFSNEKRLLVRVDKKFPTTLLLIS
ncbi:MAG: NFACT RNA binding domain-containing protein [Deltaproteobacteria bacterium]|nr:NFACT RNA binding domain-containing protein [Deltaproteobacteria bacterium]